MTGAVTDEATWAAWPPLAALPPLPQPTGRIVVVSAHPDDEVLGAGGLIAAVAGTPAQLSFVTATDGEGSHPGSALPPGELAARRSAELLAALKLLGVREPSVTRLGLPDSGLGGRLDELAAGLERATRGADLVLCPAAVDGHVDHATVGRLTLDVCRGAVPVWQFPIWLWHWTVPGAAAAGWRRAGRLDMTPLGAARKRAALRCFTTQVRALPGDEDGDVILPPEVLAHFERHFEVFLT